MKLLIAATPVSEISMTVVDDLDNSNPLATKKCWQGELIPIVTDLYKTYHVTEMVIAGPFAYIDSLAHQIAAALPYDDYGITVLINEEETKPTVINSNNSSLITPPTSDSLIAQPASGLIGLDGQELSSKPKTQKEQISQIWGV